MKKTLLLAALIAILVTACVSGRPSEQPPANNSAQQPPAATATATKVPPTSTKVPTPVPPTATPEPTATATPAAMLFPTVTFTEKTTCRMGPDKNYFAVVTYQPEQTSQANARTEDGSWLMVASQQPNKDLFCWVPATSVQDFGDVMALRTAAYAPLPPSPTMLTATEGVCGTTAAHMVLEWAPQTSGVGYYIYRNGKNIGTVYGQRFRDFDTPRSKTPYVYVYVVQAFNAAGVSPKTVSVSVTLCP